MWNQTLKEKRATMEDKKMFIPNNDKKQDDWKRDGHTLQIRGGNPDDQDPNRRPTNAVGLGRSILHVLAQDSNNGYVKVLSVGNTALCTVMKAFRIAADVVASRSDGVVLVLRQSEYVAQINGIGAKGICTRMFCIPIKDAQ